MNLKWLLRSKDWTRTDKNSITKTYALFPKLSNTDNLHNESADDVDNRATPRHFHKSPGTAIDRFKKECEYNSDIAASPNVK